MFIRALAYILANGPDGLRQTTEDAVLNANYIRAKLEDLYELPYKTASMHEVVFSDKRQAAKGVKTGDIAKRLIDYGFHPYTVSFPMIVHGALMIEPTESESLEELDLFIEAMRSHRQGSGRDSGAGEDGAAFDPRLKARRSAGRKKAHPALETSGVAARGLPSTQDHTQSRFSNAYRVESSRNSLSVTSANPSTVACAIRILSNGSL